MTLNEACDKLRFHLQQWYDKRILEHNDLMEEFIDQFELSSVKNEFMRENDLMKYNHDIDYDFKVIQGSYKKGFLCTQGC